MNNSLEYAELLDEQDNLKHLRSLFHFPQHNSKKSTSNISKSVYKKKYDEAYLAYLDANYEKSLSIFEELFSWLSILEAAYLW